MIGPALQDLVWRAERRTLKVHGQEHCLRLVEFERGWLASADTESGPTLGVDRSPYLAAARALEPLGIGLGEAIVAVGRLPR